MSDSDDLKDRLARFIDRVWNQGDVDAVDEFVGATYAVRHDPGDPWDGQTLTRDAFKDRVRKSRAPVPDQRFTIVQMLREGDLVSASWTWAGTHQGDIAEFPATGKPLTMSGLTIYDFDENGRIAGHWQLADRLAIYRQLTAGG